MGRVRPSRHGETRDLAPLDEPRLQQVMVRGCREEVATGAEVVTDRAERAEELLRVLRRLEALEHAFSSTGGPIRILRPVVEPLMPPVLRSRQHAPQGGRAAG